MRIGTRSILFGAHLWFLHPFLVARAWTHLYGFPRDYRLWIAFFAHDLGYWGRPNIDGAEGESHVEYGARLMLRWFGFKWHRLCLYHSRFYAQKNGVNPSMLCYADKLAFCYEWKWFYLFRTWLSGELREFRSRLNSKYPDSGVDNSTASKWFDGTKAHMRRYIDENAPVHIRY